MSILDLSKSENVGLVKELDEASIDLIFSNLQESQYSFPIKSFIREVSSNALDAVRERDIAHKILIEREPVSDYYLQREHEAVVDSNFDASYYDFKYIDMDAKRIKIVYMSRETEEKDIVSISDKGVGLSSKRLRNYTKLGWSSKRNTKFAIGKFGIGAKSGLATGADFYTVETIYNGWTTKLMIYRDYFHCITEETELSQVEIWKGKNKQDEEIEIKVIWNPTDEKNGVTIGLEVPKYTKDKYVQAVKEQLMYFREQIQFQRIDYGSTYDYEFSSKIMYETDNLILPEECLFIEPHLVIDKVNYGVIAWDELGMEKRRGKIAIKVAATDVDINQSRETVIWSEKTKKTLFQRIEAVTRDAESYVNSRIKKMDNPLEWYRVTAGINTNGDRILNELIRFVPKANISLTYDLSEYKKAKGLEGKGYARFITGDVLTHLFNKYNCKEVQIESRRFGKNEPTKSLSTFDVDAGRGLRCPAIYASEKNISVELVEVICEQLSVSKLCYLRLNPDAIVVTPNELASSILEDFAINLDTFEFPPEYIARKELEKAERERRKEEQREAERERIRLEKEAKKALKREPDKNEITFKAFVCRDNIERYNGDSTRSKPDYPIVQSGGFRTIKMEKVDENTLVLYGNTKDHDLMSVILTMLFTVGLFKRDMQSSESTEKLMAGTVSLDNMTIMTNTRAVNIGEFIMEKTSSGFKLHDYFIKYNTARVISKHVKEHPYLRNIHLFAGVYEPFKNVLDRWLLYKDIPVSVDEGIKALLSPWRTSPSENQLQICDAINDYLINAETLHRLVFEGEDEELKEKSKELFGSDVPLTVHSLDMELISVIEDMIKKLEPVELLLECIDYDNNLIGANAEKIVNLLKKNV